MKLLHIPTNTIIDINYTACENCLNAGYKCLTSDTNPRIACNNCQCSIHYYKKHTEEYIRIEK